MTLPTIGDALKQIHDLAEEGKVSISRNATRDTDGLRYSIDDVCDMLYELTETDCSKIEPGIKKPEWPVATFITEFEPERDEEEREEWQGACSDRLFVEVSIQSETLYVLACKLDGSPR
jgi:hypothetical protein